jgi:predicted phage terminase large subunit-like protein
VTTSPSSLALAPATAVSLAEYQAALRSDFYTFMLRCFTELNSSAEFLPSWHIEVMAAKLQAVREGRAKRVIINIPPRHLKSLAASIALPAWLLGHDPTAAIINVTYGQELSDKFARDCRAIMTASWYRLLFPTRLSSNRASLQELVSTRGGFRMATSVGGVLTGRGADIILIDDPLKPADAMSESRRVAANDWFDGTLYSRLNDKTNGAIVIVMQRLHEDDLVGHVLRQGDWELVSFPAIAEADQRHVVDTAFGRREFVRPCGAALHPERESLETLQRTRSIIGEYNFAGQYQQTPAPAGGGMVKEAWFRRYAPQDLPLSFDQIVQSWDTANKPTELADYSVCTTWGVKGPNFYLLNVLRKKLAYPDLKRAVREQKGMFAPTVILVEDKASGTQLIQELLEEGLSQITRYKPDGDKIMRLHAQTATMENGFVHVPQTAHWLADYLGELMMFPNGRHDDQVDSTAQALAWSKQRPPSWGILEYYRRAVAEMNGVATVSMVSLRAPEGVSHVSGLSGRQYLVSNRIISVEAGDAPPLVRSGFTRQV